MSVDVRRSALTLKPGRGCKCGHALLLAVILAFGAVTTARADIYRWKDRNRDLHYSNVPPSKDQSPFPFRSPFARRAPPRHSFHAGFRPGFHRR
jgi:hypothetical protein